MDETITPIHPGELLSTEFLEPMGITAHALSLAIGVPATRIHAIVHGKRGITADTALRLSRFFGLTENFWLNVQARYDLLTTRVAIAPDLARITPHSVA